MKRACFLLMLPVLLIAGSVEISLDYSAQDLTFEKSQGYDFMSLAGRGHTSEQGKPMLPLDVVHVLIPPDA